MTKEQQTSLNNLERKRYSRKKSAMLPTALKEFESLPDSANVGIQVVQGLFDWGPSSVWRGVKDGRLPAPLKFGGATRWNVGDLRRTLAAAKSAA